MVNSDSLRIGFDIGGTFCRSSVYSDQWEELSASRSPIRNELTPEKVAVRARDTLNRALSELDTTLQRVDSIGIALAAQLDRKNDEVLNAPNLGWRELDFEKIFRAQFEQLPDGIGVSVVNDLNAQLIGEHHSGSVANQRDVLAVYVGSGVGGAILSNDAIVEGTRGVAGEIGHVKVAPGGRQCGCGQRGCLEAYAGGVHLENQVEQIAEETQNLPDLTPPDRPEQIDLKKADALSEKFEEIDKIWDRATNYLAASIANACTLLNPNALVLGGGVLEHCKRFNRMLETKTSPLILEAARRDLWLRTPDLGEEAGRLGAAVYAAEQDWV